MNMWTKCCKNSSRSGSGLPVSVAHGLPVRLPVFIASAIYKMGTYHWKGASHALDSLTRVKIKVRFGGYGLGQGCVGVEVSVSWGFADIIGACFCTNMNQWALIGAASSACSACPLSTSSDLSNMLQVLNIHSGTHGSKYSDSKYEYRYKYSGVKYCTSQSTDTSNLYLSTTPVWVQVPSANLSGI